MADNLNLAITISYDPAQARAGLEVVRRAILENYAAQKDGVAAANAKLAEAQQHAQSLAAALKADGVAGESFSGWMSKAASNVRAAKDEVIAQTQALQNSRTAAQGNATSIAALAGAEARYKNEVLAAASARARSEAADRLALAAREDLTAAARRQAAATAESQARADAFVSSLRREVETAGLTRAELVRLEAAGLNLSNAQKRQVESLAKTIQGSDLDISRKILGVQAHAAVTAEIDKVRAAYTRLSAAGALTAAELTQAHDRMKAKVIELQESMNGSRTQAEKFFSAGRIVAWMVGLQQAVAMVQRLAGVFIEAQVAAERMRNTLNFAAGGQGAGAAELEYLRATANALGIDVIKAADAFGKLSAAARGTTLAGQPTREIFEAVAGASTVMGLSADQTQGALMALQQMMSKGTVQAEELRGQLGERIPGAFAIAARAMNKTEAELGKMLEAGEVMASDFLPRFAAELKKTIAGDLVDSLHSTQAELNRLSNSWADVLRAANDAGAGDAIKASIVAIADGLKSLTGMLPALATGLKVAAEALAFAGAALAVEKVVLTLWNMEKAVVAVGLASRALALTPLGLALTAAAGAAIYFNSRMEAAAAPLAALEKQAAETKTVMADLHKAMDRITSAGGDAEYLRQLSQAYRNNRITAKEASLAAAGYAQSLEIVAAGARAAKAVLASYLPPVDKMKAELAKLRAAQDESQEKDKLSAAAYTAARNKIIHDAFKDQQKLFEDLRKDAVARELTAEQQKIAALLDAEKKHVAAAAGNETLIRAARAATTEGVKALARDEYLVTKKSAEDRYKEIKANLVKAAAEEDKYAGIVRTIADELAGRKQAWADADRERGRQSMSGASAQLDIIKQIDEKLAAAAGARRQGDEAAAKALAEQGIQLAGTVKNTNDRAAAEQRARAIIEESYQAEIAKNTDLMRSAEERKTRLIAAGKAQKQELDGVTDRLAALDQALKNPRALSIDTSVALDKIAEVKRRIDEISTATIAAPSAGGAGMIDNGDGTSYSSSTGAIVTRAGGGRLYGPGTDTSDSIILRGSKDEFVVKAASSRRVGYGVLDYINQHGALPRFAEGGRVGGGAAPAAAAGIVIQNLNLPAVTNARAFVAELRQILRTEPDLLSPGFARAG